MSIDEKIACAVNVFFGAAIGFVIYLFALGGFKFLLMSRPGNWWNGWGAFLVCVVGGGLVGWFSYEHRLKQLNIDLPDEGMYQGAAGRELLLRRLGVIAMAIVAIYFIWQLAKGI